MQDNENKFLPEEFSEPINIENVLDLHGFYPEQISEVLNHFLKHAQNKGYKEVRIVHGKGKSRLKFEVRQFLKQDSRVIEFGDAPPFLGGWGAAVVKIKKK